MTQANLQITEIVPGSNDRTSFNPSALQDLADSIRTHGLAQPIIVRPIALCETCGASYSEAPELCPCGGGEFANLYQIVAGERRYRAVKLLSWTEVPAIIRALSNEEAAALMLAENTARADLDPIDEGRAYQTRMDLYGWSASECAQQAGVSTVRVQFRLKLLELRQDLQALIRSGDLGLGYAQILSDAALDNDRQLIALGRLRDNGSPTPGWFRSQVGQLKAEQSQATLFDLPLISGRAIPVEAHSSQPEPAHPTTTTPPRVGRTFRQIVENQASFWLEAAGQWDALGKPFKRQECEAAASALTLALQAV